MTFTRRFFVGFASAVGALGLMPRKVKAEDKKRLEGDKGVFEPQRVGVQTSLERPAQDFGCATIYPVGITTTSHDVKSGKAVWQSCKDQPKAVGMALTDAAGGDPVTIMVGYVPPGSVPPE